MHCITGGGITDKSLPFVSDLSFIQLSAMQQFYATAHSSVHATCFWSSSTVSLVSMSVRQSGLLSVDLFDSLLCCPACPTVAYTVPLAVQIFPLRLGLLKVPLVALLCSSHRKAPRLCFTSF